MLSSLKLLSNNRYIYFPLTEQYFVNVFEQQLASFTSLRRETERQIARTSVTCCFRARARHHVPFPVGSGSQYRRPTVATAAVELTTWIMRLVSSPQCLLIPRFRVYPTKLLQITTNLPTPLRLIDLFSIKL